MEQWYPIVIGTVAFCYVQLFNWNAKTWLKWGSNPRDYSSADLKPAPLTTPAFNRLINGTGV